MLIVYYFDKQGLTNDFLATTMFRIGGQTQFYLWTVLFTSLFPMLSYASGDSVNLSQLRILENIRFENPDRALQEISTFYEERMKEQDTLMAIKALASLSAVHGNMGNYSGSYDDLWKALFLADQIRSDSNKVFLYQRIGRFYAYYQRREKAISIINKALTLNKGLVLGGVMKPFSLAHRYFALSTSYQEFGNLELAQTYLDSCLMFYDERERRSLKLPFLKMTGAFIKKESGHVEESILDMESLLPWFENRLPSYRVIVYSHLGDAYLGKGDYATGEAYYKKALEIARDFHSHLDFSIKVYDKLAGVYFDQGQYQKAYQEQEKAAELKELIFDSRSGYNQPLLEIRDEFRNTKEAKERLIKEKRIAQLEHENKERVLRNIIISVLASSLLLFGLLFFYYLRNKHRVEKRIIQLEVKSNKELLEMKNKELATSTLKLIEKEKFLKELKSRMAVHNGSIDLQEINRLINTVRISSTHTWAAFETQFTSINNGFFERLKENYPTLTQGEKRLCALIKSKLNSNEIAGLMNISVESVHKSRYRLRKKLQLGKEMDLADFIDRIV